VAQVADGDAWFDIEEARTQLSRIIDRVEHGAEIVICRAGQPVAKVIPLEPRARRTGSGSLRGQIVLDDVWDSAETNEEIAHDFGMLP
jgi:prevent-host-death family protein